MATSFSLSSLLLSCALAWPVPAQAQAVDGKTPASRSPAATDSGLGLAPPDLPPSVDLAPSDLRQPGDKAPAAVSRLVADPARIPRSSALVAGSALGSPGVAPEPSAAPASASTKGENPEAFSRPVVDLPSGTVAAIPNQAPVPSAPLLPVAPPQTASVPAPPLAAPPAPDAASMPATSSSPGEALSPARAAPPGGEPAAAPESVAILDPASLQKALDAYVGPEPVPGTGRIQPREQARYQERQALRAAYAARGFAPLWIGDGAFNAKGRSILARIDRATEDGLDLHAFTVATPKGSDPAALANAELSLSEAAVAYGRQATGGRVDPARIGDLIAAKPDVAGPARIIGALSDAADAGDALRDFNPPQKGYALLRDKLAGLRKTDDVASRAAIPYGRMLKLGMRDPRVPLIRARFGLDMPISDEADAGLVYDTQVAEAVAGFQKAHHLPASGMLTIRTVAALSWGDPKRLEGEIIANMERWRWLPRDMGEARIVVNIPDFTLDVMHGDAVFHHARVVVGQPDKPTPVFSQTMQFIIVNPYWNVPLSIVKKEMMPKLAADPDYFEHHGYETVERNGQTYVRQPPGDSNALGRIKFMFPNTYSVYLHDTNARSLFGNERRALSHGCVRVDAPFKFAEAVLGKENGWTEARVKRLVGGNERTITLPHPLPIHIVYFTAFVNDAGSLELRDDVYGYSAKLRAALGLEGSTPSGQVAVN